MKLTRRALRTYQYTAVFFSTVSLIFINHPTIFLTPVLILLTLTLYILRSIWSLKKINERDFNVFLTVSPNIVSVGDKSKVRLYAETNLNDRLKIDINVSISEGLRVESGEASRSDVISRKNSIVLEIIVKAQKSGSLEVGPIEIVVKDDLELVCKVINIESTVMIYSFEEPMRARGVVLTTLPAGLNYPGYTLHPFIGINEEYRESIESEQHSLKNIDWRRTARRDGEEVYIKEYDKRRSSDIIIGFGSGLDLEIPPYGNVLNWIMQVSISYALHYLREGSRIWLLNYNDGRPAITQIRLKYGELTLREKSVPTGGYLLYISRLIDSEELNILREYLMNNDFRMKILLIDLLDEASGLLEDRVIGNEARRLDKTSSILRESVTIVKLRDFINSFKRALAAR